MTLTIIFLAWFAATLGAISGLGGGIFLMPLLVETFGREHGPASLAALSLSVVLLNSLTSLFIGKQIKNIDRPFARRMAVFSVVGVMIGVYLQSLVTRESFQVFLGGFLFLLAIYILWRSPRADSSPKVAKVGFNWLDFVFSVGVGTVASFFGIGGGVLQMPYMVYIRKFPVKQATATSQFILATVAAGTLVLIVVWRGAPVMWSAFLLMAPAVILGGILGSRLGAEIRGPWIVRIVGVLLLIMAYRVSR